MKVYKERVGRGVILEWTATDMFARRSASSKVVAGPSAEGVGRLEMGARWDSRQRHNNRDIKTSTQVPLINGSIPRALAHAGRG